MPLVSFCPILRSGGNMEFNDLIRKRRSCRAFSAQAIPCDVIQRILEAGRLAPTAKNLQEQRIYVIASEEGLRKVDAITPCRYGAPVVLAIAYDRKNVFVYPGEHYDSGREDASIVATHLMLAAENEGVNSCWLNRFDPDEAAKTLGLPENEEILMLLDLGYKAEGAVLSPKLRKSLSELVTYI